MADNGNENKGGVGRAFFNMLTVAIIAVVIIHTMNKAETIFAKSDEPALSSTFISEKLERVSELTTAKLTYNGLVQYSDGKVPFLTKKAFSMAYRGEVKAGIELSDTDIEIKDTSVTLTLPEVEVLSVIVDSESIQFYDEKAALFNWKDREDVVEAVQKAEEDVKKNADIDGLKLEAKEQSEALIRNLFEGTIGERELIINYEN